MIIYTGDYKLCFTEILEKGYDIKDSYCMDSTKEDISLPLFLISNTVYDRPGALQSERSQYQLGIDFCYVHKDIIIYTHNQMFLNGVRVGVKRELISNKDVEIIYYCPKGERFNVLIESNGGIEHWPDGFFDVEDESYSELFGI